MDELDRTSEKIERAALLSLHDHCPAETREAIGLFSEEVAGALVCGASKDPSILLNRTLGLGLDEPITREQIEAIHAVYERHGVQRYFLHVYPTALADGENTFSGTPLEKARGWMKFRRDTSPSSTRETDLRVQRVGKPGSLHFGEIVAAAFGMTEASAPLLAGLVDDPRWHLFVSYDGDEPAGAGSLFVDEGYGWVEWGATYPTFRRRGSQGAIMSARIDRALELGCQAMFTETGEAAGDDPQHSYRNIERSGFVQSVLRQNWAPPKA
jgi:GNAT superfamily N-acetyltransferase